MFRQDFTCPALLESLSLFDAYGAVTHYGRPFQVVRLYVTTALAWSRFARHYYGSLRLMSFPPGTEMFQFPGFAL